MISFFIGKPLGMYWYFAAENLPNKIVYISQRKKDLFTKSFLSGRYDREIKQTCCVSKMGASADIWQGN